MAQRITKLVPPRHLGLLTLRGAWQRLGTAQAAVRNMTRRATATLAAVMMLALTAQTAWAYVGNTDPFMQVLSSPTYDDNGGKTVTVRLWVWNYDGDNAYYVSTPTLYIDDEATSVRPGSMWSTMLTTNENSIKDYTNSGTVGSSSDIVINNVNYGTAQLKNVQKNQTSAQGQSYGDGAQSKWTTVDLELNFNSAFSYGHHTLALTGQWLDHCDNKNKGSENKTVNASMTGVYGITIPDGFTVTGVNPSATYSSVNYYAQGTELTITFANEKRYIKSLTATGTGASATVADDKHSATVTVGTSDVTVNATILSTFSGGSGTQADPYKISSSADLVLLATDINNSTERLYVDEYFVQTCDIDMGGIDFVPIGIGERDFDKFRGKYNGQYNGKQYTISNLTVNGSYGKAGLFGHLADVDLDNIRLVSPSITNTNTNSYTGVLVGYSDMSGIHNCIVINPTLSGGNHVGVFAGGQDAGNIRYSYFTGNNSYNSVGSCYGKNANTSIGHTYALTFSGCVTTSTEAAFTYNSASYYLEGTTITLGNSISEGLHVTYKAGDKTLEGNTYTVNSTDGDITLTATIDGTCGDGLTWRISDENSDGTYETLSINYDGTGTGRMNNYVGNTDAPWYADFCSSITTVNIANGVSYIGDYAFRKCTAVSCFTLPASVSEIGTGSFNGCTSLARINIQKIDGIVIIGNYALASCPALESIVVPTPALALDYSTSMVWNAYALRFLTKFRTEFGGQLFSATDEGGTPAYAITNDTDLRNLATAVNAGNDGSGKTFRQTADIDLKGNVFAPIGNNNTFGGSFDGGSHNISGLVVNENYNDFGGLVGRLDGGTVKNVILVEPNVVNIGNDNKRVGAVVGSCEGNNNNIVENCHVINPTVSATGSGTNYVGAIIGRILAKSTRVTNCYFYDSNADHNYSACGDININASITNCGPAHLVTLGEYVTATPAIGTDGANGFQYGGNSYYRDGIVLALDTDERTGYTCTGFETTAGILNGSELTVTADATVNAMWAKNTMTLIDNADNSVAITNAQGKVADVTLQGRTLYKDGKWNTLCLPFAMTAEQIAANSDFAGATLMTLDVTEKNGFDTADGTLYLWFKSATEIEAGVPYLVKWTKAADYEGNEANYDISNPVFEGVTISNTAAQAVESTTAGLEIVEMVGNYSPVSVTADDKSILFLSDANTLYYSSIDRQIRSCRAYFSVPYIKGNVGAKACAFSLNFDSDEATGIISIENGDLKIEKESDGWYDLNGRRLNGKPTAKGLYIHNGRKEVVE